MATLAFPGPIWQLQFAADGTRAAVACRDAAARQTSFYSVDLQRPAAIAGPYTAPEPWWVQLTGTDGHRVEVAVFENERRPIPTQTFGFDFSTGEALGPVPPSAFGAPELVFPETLPASDERFERIAAQIRTLENTAPVLQLEVLNWSALQLLGYYTPNSNGGWTHRLLGLHAQETWLQCTLLEHTNALALDPYVVVGQRLLAVVQRSQLLVEALSHVGPR